MRKVASFTALGLLALGAPLLAQDRITRPVNPDRRVALPSRVPFQVRAENDLGRMDRNTPIQFATVMLRLAPDLDSFLAEQQSPSSPNFHRWLTPQQFGERFGASPNDLAQISAWLRSQGLTVHDVAQGRHWISFSGTAGQVEDAFRTELHRYDVAGEMHFANAIEPSVPEVIGSLVSEVDGLHDFVPKPMLVRADPSPAYNLGGSHYLAPDDLATIYNIAPLYRQGIDGRGQKVAVLGRTEILLSDIRSFRNRFGLPVNDPQQMLFGPSPGLLPGDLLEADLDLQWTGAVARNATIIYVYSRDIFLSAKYAVDNNVAPVMTMSYGSCELFPSLGLRGIAQQANAQGITWMVASGDGGAATCDSLFAQTPEATLGATVSFPASLPEITAVGGTEFNEGTGNFWSPTNDANNASALSYIPERPWNNALARNALIGAGGGASAFFPKPFWQVGPGVPNDRARDLPDISLSASSTHVPYYTVYQGGAVGVGGTSASSPAFAGIVTLMNQYLIGAGVITQPGLGNINPALYRMAQSTPAAFHDVTEGDILMPCALSSPGCVSGLVGFRANVGFDLASGLGSVDALQLATKWNPGAGSVTKLTADSINPNLSDTVVLTATVSSSSGAGTPTGTVAFLANGVTLATAALAGGTATARVAATQVAAAPNSKVEALYGGDAQFAGSGGSATVNLLLPPSVAYVTISVSPNPVQQVGPTWPYFLTLTEKGGVNATLRNFTVNDVAQALPGGFPSTSLPANGTLTARLAGSGITPPLIRVFRVSGTDANGGSWSQELSVSFVAGQGPVVTGGMTLTLAPSTAFVNPDAGAACRWTQELIVQETGGFFLQLTAFRALSTDMTSKIQSVFGTTRLAPFGVLRGTMCFDSFTAPGNVTYSLTGSGALGTIAAAAQGSLSAGVANGPSFTVSPSSVVLTATDTSQNPGANVALDLGTGSPQWSVTVAPARATWLNATPPSGAGVGTLRLDAFTSGLSPGAYTAFVIIQAPNVNPPSITIPVTLVVGASSSVKLDGVANGASFKTAFAPGMLLSVFGSGLAGATLPAPRVPLPLTMSGVSATVNGVTAPLYYVSPGQINLQIPYETGLGTAVLGINNNGKVASFPFQIGVAAPGIFAAQDGSLVPASTGNLGDTLVAFITGDGDLTPTLATGAAPPASTAVSRLPKSRLPLSLTVGGVPADVAFSGVPTWAAGVTQINFTIPAGVAAGVQPVVVTVGAVASPPVNITVTAPTGGKP